MGAVLVHIDLDGDRPHPSSMAALAAGRAVASSWGGTLYAALVVHDPDERSAADATSQISTRRVPGLDAARAAIARGGADKIVLAITDAPILPLWAMVGTAWQGVLDHLRPRLVLFGADAPSAAELGPRTGARIGARLLSRARAVGLDHVELRDRDGGYVRVGDGGAAVVMIGAMRPVVGPADDDIDVVVLALPGGVDTRIELAGSGPAELAHTGGTVVAVDDEVASDPQAMRSVTRLAGMLGAHVIGGPAGVRHGAIAPGAVVDRATALAPELCVAVGNPALDLAGAASYIKIGGSGKHADGAIGGLAGPALAELIRTLEDS